MQQSEFEKQVQQKMEELKLLPADAVWQKVAAGLPAEKKPRRWVFFILLLAGLLAGSAVLWNNFTGKDKMADRKSIAKIKAGEQNNITEDKADNEGIPAIGAAATPNNNDSITIKLNSDINNKISEVAKIKGNQKKEIVFNNTAGNNTAGSTAKQIKTKTAVKIKTKAPLAVDADEKEYITAAEKKDITYNAKTVVGVKVPVAVNDETIEPAKKLATDSSFITNENDVSKDTAITTINSTNQKKKNNIQWQYGIRLAAGTGALKKDFFGNTPLFAADARLFNSSGLPPIVQPVAPPNNPVTGLAVNIGFYIQKNITGSWTFSTGLNYAFQSNAIQVGTRVDSAVTFNFNASKSLAANNYYRIGDDVKYKNNFHFIEVPLLFQWKLSKKSPVYFEGGPTLRYLVNSNALVYNSNSGAYFTDAAVFNKLLLSFTAGAGINLAQNKKLPFSVGYQFGYSTGSATKKVFGKQHFVNSMLYVKIPFKK